MRTAALLSIPFVLCALFTPAPMAAQQAGARMVLQVLAHGTGEPLRDAQVRIAALGLSRITGEDGVARIGGIRAGTYQVEIGRVGYQTERIAVEFSPGQVVEGEVEMTAQPIALDSLQVTAAPQSRRLNINGFYNRKEMGFGTFLGRDQIRARGVRAILAVQGVERTRLRPDRTGLGYQVLQSRFGEPCAVYVWIDGRPASAAELGNLHSDDIEAMEVYSGEHLPMQFNFVKARGSRCGAVVVWTGLPR